MIWFGIIGVFIFGLGAGGLLARWADDTIPTVTGPFQLNIPTCRGKMVHLKEVHIDKATGDIRGTFIDMKTHKGAASDDHGSGSPEA